MIAFFHQNMYYFCRVQDDILLYKLIAQGDQKAFKYLFDLYFVPLCRFGILYLKDQQEVEQIAMDIFTYVWEEKEHIEIHLSYKAYLFNSMRNRCLNVLRDRKEMCALDEADLLYSEDYSPLELKELAQLIEAAVLSLPDKCQSIFRKSREKHLSYKEIADELGISVKTVEVQISKALKRIKDTLGDKYTFLF